MGFIDWLLPKEYRFFDMLKEHSAKTVRGAHRFQDFIRDFSSLDEEKKREYMKGIKHIEEEADFQRA